MPYTPPSKTSPPATAAGSPNESPRSSGVNGRPLLPRSASYLTKHRRSPSSVGSVSSVTEHGGSNQPTPPGTTVDLKGLVPSDSVRQSPPPVTDRRGMPSGAVLSPPESPSGSDDEGLEMRGRKLPNLKELKDAISHISMRRESSPTRSSEPMLLAKAAAAAGGLHTSFSTGALDSLTASQRTNQARSGNLSHGLSVKTQESSIASDEESDGELRAKPPMIRKKSGELVRPALRPPSRRRPSSMPGTPTFSKAVHFDSNLEHVRHFLQVDRPLAVSAGSSPMDNFESDSEYPFPTSEDQKPSRRGPPYEWELSTANFPTETVVRKALPARVEKIWLSNDSKSLHGSVAVANLAFNKSVACRFTLDYWKTTSEVSAEYTSEIRPHTTAQPYDRFTFTIKLSDLANLESKTLFFCVRYNVNGQEYWDNNAGSNFQVDFRKHYVAQNGKKNFQGAGAKPVAGELPRSTRRANPNTSPRPKSMPVGFSSQQFMDQARQAKLDLGRPMDDYPIKLKSKLAGNAPSDNLAKNVSTPSGQAFGNRYDFSTSLKEASSRRAVPGTRETKPPMSPTNGGDVAAAPRRQEAATRSHSGTDSPTTGDYSYEEILDRFCFFGSKQTASPVKGPAPRSGNSGSRFNGQDDGFGSMSDANSTYHHHSYAPYRTGAAQHHTLKIDPNPYFANALSPNRASSPAVSPLTGLAPPLNPTVADDSRSASPGSFTGGLSPRTAIRG